ncbi:CDP-glycerol glycerophosphotransferase [Sedimentibacter acidaminivorans]|uniref:CDP-glycerol glycerophosphotransferase n=1 Tax=Sedimentibacter acidaminivorans TaxID=913099 RepID=A0ABS4G997_9FIRM|nr:CDP-glycerol glycerophosphotransferase family protein [Sedimentibacter acidaminivorans]MBP1924257.1 CDP-glycerol glycerophosphotransferase [Sedimentibacter acidaminivorans]
MNYKNIIKKKPFLYNTAKKFRITVKKSYMMICNKIYGVEDKNIVFKSFGGKSYSDNPKAISEELHRLNPELNIIWSFKDPQNKEKIVPQYIKCVKSNTFNELKTLATSKFWIDNFNKPLFTYKSKDQVYIQTWHGDRAFKKILFDSTFAPSDYKLIETTICDVIITGSEFAEIMYKSAYRYMGEFLRVGSPRNDVLINVNQERVNRIKNELGINEDDKVILYAPTLRREAAKEKENQEIVDIDLLGVLNKLTSVTESKWICLTRAHSAVSGLKGIPTNSNIIDVTEYEDMADLLQITDLLITDYSSSATDFILTKKPTILYQSDYQEYIMNDRTFYYDLKETGFLITYNNEELYECINKVFSENTEIRNEKIQEFYGVYEKGLASKKVAEYVVGKSDRREN